MNLNLDIHTFVQVLVVLAFLGMVLSLWLGVNAIRSARELPFFLKRRQRIVRGWRLFFFAIVLGILGTLSRSYAEPLAYRFFPPSPTVTPSPTITLTPTVSLTPSVTLTPSITLTPSETDTPTVTPTPHVPMAVVSQFEGQVTPNPEAVFSPLQFTQGIDENYQPLRPGSEFRNPVGHLYAVFSYDKMVDGVQWTALWYRNGELVYFETKPWDGGSGGFGYTDWNPPSDMWEAGEYQVHIFVGMELKRSGTFTVVGEPPTVTPAPIANTTETPSGVEPTFTHTPSATGQLAPTPSPTITRRPKATPITPSPTITRWPTATALTPSPTITRWPTATASP